MLRLMLDNFTNRLSDWKEQESVVLTKALLTAITQSPENHLTLVTLLVDRGARINYKMSDSLPNLPLEAAATRNLLDVVEYLLNPHDKMNQRADPCAESGIHGTALRAAIATQHVGVANCLINRQAQYFGIEKRSSTAGLIDQTINPSTSTTPDIEGPTDQPEVTDLTTVQTDGSNEEYLSRRNDPIAKKNVEKRAEWICRDAEYGNILQLATSRGLRSTVALLLEYGADPNVKDTSDRTSLHIASWFGFPKIVNLLLDNEGDKADIMITAKDEWGATALDQTEESLDRDGHPGGTDADLQIIKQTLVDRLVEVNRDKPGTPFKGPKKIKPVSKTKLPEADVGQPNLGEGKARQAKSVAEEAELPFKKVKRTGAEQPPREAEPPSLTTESLPGDIKQLSEEHSTLREGKPRGAQPVLPRVKPALRNAKPVFTMPSWIPGLGFHATIVDIWDDKDQECLLLKQPKVDEILYHKAVLDAIMKHEGKPAKATDKVRWIHLPTNNVSLLLFTLKVTQALTILDDMGRSMYSMAIYK